MPLQVHVCADSTHSQVEKFFPPPRRDAFHEPAVQRALHGANWQSVFITDGSRAWFHVFAASRIPGTEWSDVDPFLGYFGPVTTTDDAEFNALALAEYRAVCASQGIIAEVMRFNPLLENHRAFAGQAALTISPVKSLVICDCVADETAQLAFYNQNCRRLMRKAADLQLEWLPPDQAAAFISFYYDSLRRVGAVERWFIPEAVLGGLLRLPACRVAVTTRGGWKSATLIIEHPLQTYYLLAANCAERTEGSNETLVHHVCLDQARKGNSHFMLGGGNSPDEADKLLLFKRKFSSRNYTLQLGKMIHLPEAYTALCQQYDAKTDLAARKNYFLKYRLLPEYA
jgi:UDP-N-acetylbacillosamine alanyltransferase